MEDARRTYNIDDEFGDFYVFYSFDGTKSKEIHINMVETIKGLQKDIHFYKFDNERLMRDKEKEDDFNVKLMKSLDIIEYKMCKETKSIRSRSPRSHNEKIREARNKYRHHHHSPKHLFSKVCNSSSPYPIKKHKKRTRVDDQYGELNKIKPRTFGI